MAYNLGQKFSYSLLLPVLPVMIPGLVHFTFASLALIAIVNLSFFFTHLLLLVAVFWTALDRKRYEPVVCFMVVLVVSAITDIVILALSFNTIVRIFGDLGRFTVAMIIINLLCKPVTLILSILTLYSRRESFGITKSNAQSDSAKPNQTLPTYPTTPEFTPVNVGVVPPGHGQPASYPPPQPTYY